MIANTSTFEVLWAAFVYEQGVDTGEHAYFDAGYNVWARSAFVAGEYYMVHFCLEDGLVSKYRATFVREYGYGGNPYQQRLYEQECAALVELHIPKDKVQLMLLQIELQT